MTAGTHVQEAADRLREAARTGVACAPVRDLLPGGSVEEAYAVAAINTGRDEAEGRLPSGWKIGLTSEVVQRQLGVDQPDFGVLFSDTEIVDGAEVDLAGLLQPRIEAEVAFVLGRALDGPRITALDVVRATEFVVPALEIVDSRVAGWDITITDTVADNASAGRYVIGTRPRALGHVDLLSAEMALEADGAVVSTGTGAACLGNPVRAVAWLAGVAVRFGRPLRAGDVVLSGALGPMVDVTPGTTYRADIGGIGTVGVSFAASTEGEPS